jgi:hypothetical protein
MSSRLPAVKERLTGIKSMLAAVKGREGYAAGLQLRLGRVTNIITENESKVWLRRRAAEQLLKDLQDSLDAAFKVLEGGESALERFEAALREVERRATKIEDESRRQAELPTNYLKKLTCMCAR